ncbi:hypothetical protein D1BOALGB6SA_10320 [Olavius sp. associated proteobacterium Delta 1]|nr:hypothetical protein D1BOALGB6SA_10320 [Olavius sp. associated proteobacterium Delta 1]
MTTQANEHQKIRAEILKGINLAWEKIEALEKKSIKFLGEDDPTSEALGYAAVHLMNASQDIQDHLSQKTSKLKPKSLNYLLEVLSKIRWSGSENRQELHEAYLFAYKAVRKKYNLTKQTVIDVCNRRLGFTGDGATDRFLDNVEGWLFRNEAGLRNVIREHTNNWQHKKIDEFFMNGGIIQ